MAQDLLERMYTAYQKRTEALEEVLAEKSVMQEEIEERKVRTRHLQVQLERVSETAEKEKHEKDEVIAILVKELETEKVKMEEERSEWEEEKERWETVERERIKQEILLDMVTRTNGEDHLTVDEDAEMTPKKKRISTGGASSDSGFDESDTDSFYSMTTGKVTADGLAKKPSLASISTTTFSDPSTPTRPAKTENITEKRIRMVPSSIPNGSQIGFKCESCARTTFNGLGSRPSSPTLSVKTASSPVNGVNPLRFPTPLSKNYEPSPPAQAAVQQSPAPSSAATTASRWGFGVLRGNNNSAQAQQELDRLRGENKNLRERVGDLEKSVDDALGVLGGWRT